MPMPRLTHPFDWAFFETSRTHAAWQLWIGAGLIAAAPLTQAQTAPHEAPTAKAQTAEQPPMPEVEVRGQDMSARTYSREQMDATPQSNRDLAGLIADHPALRPITDESGSGNRGSLAPESFSIHGESPFQNQFQIDGISATNVIKPHERNNLTNGGPDAMTSYSQSYNIDTEIFDQVDVFDSRVPIEFSGFTGGVIDAKIKNPTGSGQWKIKRSFNSSNLTQQEFAADAFDTCQVPDDCTRS